MVRQRRYVGCVQVNLEVSYSGNYFPDTADLQQVADQGGELKCTLFQLLP